MKLLFVIVLVLLCSLCYTQGLDTTLINSPIPNVRKTILAFTSIGAVDSVALPPIFSGGKQRAGPEIKLRLDNYYSSETSIQSRSRLHLVREQSFKGLVFRIGGDMYLNDWMLDKRRSGVVFNLNSRSSFEKIKLENSDLVKASSLNAIQRIASINPRVLAAREVVMLDSMLNFMNTPEFKRYYSSKFHDERAGLSKKIDVFQDSLDRRKELENFQREYRELLNRVKTYSPEVRANSRFIMDSLYNSLTVNRDEILKSKLLTTSRTSLLQKVGLLTKNFSLGNTRMPDDDFISAGLPIRGVAYRYAHKGIQVELHHGRRVVSTNFLPQEGVLYHDLNSNYRFTQLGFKYGKKGDSQYDFSLIRSQEVNLKNSSHSFFPLVNTVAAVKGRTVINKAIEVNSRFAISQTKLKKGGVDAPIERNEILDLSSTRLGLSLEASAIELELAVFRNGIFFKSFANPYLFSDYEGVEGVLHGNALDGKLSGRLSVAHGHGTTALTKRNSRWRIQGGIRYFIAPDASVGVVVSPNVYRQTINNDEGLGETSIYRVDMQKNSEKWGAVLSLTNLRQGLNWSDTTTVSKSMVGQAALNVKLSQKIAVEVHGRQSIEVLGAPAAREWMHGFTLNFDGLVRYSVGVNNSLFAGEEKGAPGVNFDLFCQLGKYLGNIHLNLFYRGGTDGVGRRVFSQQTWGNEF